MNRPVAIPGAFLLAAMAILAPIAQAEQKTTTPESLTPADAVWVAHLDVKAMLDTSVGKWLTDHINTSEKHKAKMKEFVEKVGFDPRTDLTSITIWGRGFDRSSGVVVVKCNVNKEKLLAILKENEGHKTHTHGNYTVHEWTQKPEDPTDTGVRYGAFHGTDLTIIGRDRSEVQRGLDVLDGKQAALSSKTEVSILPAATAGAFMIGGAVDIDKIDKLPRRAAMMKELKTITMQMGESAGSMFFTLTGVAKEQQKAQQMRQAMQGMIALASLHMNNMVNQGKPMPPWAPLLEGLTVGGSQDQVSITLSLKSADIIKKFDEHEARKAQRAGG